MIFFCKNRFQSTVLSVKNLVVDDYFNAFTSPNVNGKFEEKTCGEGPSLVAMFEDDKQLHQLISETSVSFQIKFSNIQSYLLFIDIK